MERDTSLLTQPSSEAMLFRIRNRRRKASPFSRRAAAESSRSRVHPVYPHPAALGSLRRGGIHRGHEPQQSTRHNGHNGPTATTTTTALKTATWNAYFQKLTDQSMDPDISANTCTYAYRYAHEGRLQHQGNCSAGAIRLARRNWWACHP